MEERKICLHIEQEENLSRIHFAIEVIVKQV